MTNDEEAPSKQIKSEASTNARVLETHEFPRGAHNAQASSKKRTPATHSGLSGTSSILASKVPLKKTRLKFTRVFRAIYRRGRWARGALLSVGTLPNIVGTTRIGLRTRRNLKGAAVRNRLKRQLRSIAFADKLPLQAGLDLVILIHPSTCPVLSNRLESELRTLCKRLGVLSISS